MDDWSIPTTGILFGSAEVSSKFGEPEIGTPPCMVTRLRLIMVEDHAVETPCFNKFLLRMGEVTALL